MSADSELGRLYDAHAASMFGYLLSLTQNEADSRDLLQSLFCRLGRKPELMLDVRDERAFLLRMAHNAVVDLARRTDARKRQADALSAQSAELFAPSPDPDESTFRRELDRALTELPPEQRAVVHLKLWEGLTFEVIATTLDIPLNTAASRYRYGLDKLRTRLRPLYEEIQ